MPTRERSFEVLFSDDSIVELSRLDLALLDTRLPASITGRVRFCAHGDASESLHEMFVLIARDNYVRPHKHPGKVESFHIVRGQVDVVIFDDTGKIETVLQLGDYQSGLAFFYRLSKPLFHTVLVRSESVLIHETTNGPFSKSDSIYAPWAPEESNELAKLFLEDLNASVEAFLAGQTKFPPSIDGHCSV
ncbi:MAG: WbuC family cupin fold metalloprotein [Candidatus Obscuribacterales bacterium]|nr:WbuC family cupin fold metalloprotein [Candidatus Obscuribacterales bacterium]